MADAAGNLNLGTLTVQLAADVSRLQKEFNKAFKETERLKEEAHSLRNSFDRAFNGTAVAATRVAGNLNQIGESVAKVFGENGLASAKKFAESMGIMPGQVEAISIALKGLGGAFSAVAVAAGAMSAPLAAALAMVVGLVGAYGALKKTGVLKDAAAEFRFQKASLTGDQKELEKLAIEKEPEWGFLSKTMEDTGLGPAASPESPAGSSLKSDIGSALKESFGEAWKDIAPLIEQVKSALAPDTTKKDAEEAKKAAADAAKAEKEHRAILQDAFDESAAIAREDAEAMKETQEAQEQAAADAAVRTEKLQEAFDDIQKEETEAREKELFAREEAAQDFSAKLKKSLDDEIRRRKDAIDRMYGSLSSGRIGSAVNEYRVSQGKSDHMTTGLVAADQLGSAMGGSQYSGAAMQGAATGAQVGGPWGALIGAGVALLTKSEGFKRVLESLDGVLGPIAEALGKTIGPISRVLSVVGEVIAPILEAIEPSLWSAAVAFNSVAAVIKLLVSAVNWVIYGFKSAANWLFDALAGIVDKIPGLGDVADWLRDQKLDAESNKKAAEQAWSDFKSAWGADLFKYEDDTTAVDDLGSAAADAASSMREFSESLTNLPSGYKIALARYNAAAPLGGTGADAGGSTTITINVNGGDAGETWKQIKKHMRRDGFLESAFSPVAG